MTGEAFITTIAFSPDGRHLVVPAGQQLLIVNIDVPALVRRACGIAGEALEESEWSDVAGTRPFMNVCR